MVGPDVQESGLYQIDSSYLLTTKKGASGQYTDSMIYAFMPWTGDGIFTVRLTELNGFGAKVSSYASAGISLRASTAGGATSAFSGLGTNKYSPVSFYRDAAGTRASSGSGSASQVTLPFWMRLVRTGNAVSAFYSLDGTTWTPHTPAAMTLNNLPAKTVVGLSFDAQNGTLSSARFDNLTCLETPTVTTKSPAITLDWTGSLANRYSVQRSTVAAGPFTTIATDLRVTTYADASITAKTAYFYTITAFSEDGYTTTSPVVSVPALQPVTITLTPVSVAADGKVHLPAITITPALDAGATLTWSWSGTGITDATLPPTGVGNYTVVATVSGTQTGTANTTVTLTAGGTVINPIPTTITIAKQTNAVFDGNPHAIVPPTVTVAAGSALIIRYRPLTGDPGAGGIPVAGSTWSTLPPIEPGWYAVEARLIGTQVGTATGNLFIDRASPSITWATPAPVAANTVLGSRQLAASTAIPGNFVYTPAAGSVVSTAGTMTLSALFTPTDTTHYRTITTTVSLQVQAIPVTVVMTSIPAVPYDGQSHPVSVVLNPAVPAATISITYQAWSGDPHDSSTKATGSISSDAPVAAGWYRAVATAGGSCSGTATGSVNILVATEPPNGTPASSGGGGGGGGGCGAGDAAALILLAVFMLTLRRRES